MNIAVQYIGFLSVIFSLIACKGEGCNVIPDINVRVQFSQANLPDGFGYLQGGVCGIVVSRDLSGNYVAFDRCSTVNPEKRNRVEVQNSLTAKDPVSGAEWYLFDGSPSKLAECPLKQYYVRQQGNIYYVEF